MDFERKDGQKIKHELLIVMEQPELHLHPRFQARFANLLTEMISYCKKEKKDIRFIIETHSEIILNKIGENIALEKFDREDTNVVLFNAKGENMEKYVEISTYSKDGFLTNWPMGFFAEHVD
jgi:predicted ATPase